MASIDIKKLIIKLKHEVNIIKKDEKIIISKNVSFFREAILFIHFKMESFLYQKLFNHLYHYSLFQSDHLNFAKDVINFIILIENMRFSKLHDLAKKYKLCSGSVLNHMEIINQIRNKMMHPIGKGHRDYYKKLENNVFFAQELLKIIDATEWLNRAKENKDREYEVISQIVELRKQRKN